APAREGDGFDRGIDLCRPWRADMSRSVACLPKIPLSRALRSDPSVAASFTNWHAPRPIIKCEIRPVLCQTRRFSCAAPVGGSPPALGLRTEIDRFGSAVAALAYLCSRQAQSRIFFAIELARSVGPLPRIAA